MNRIIWSCWFQGLENAPPLVKKCLRSWQRNNPGWEFRCLDAASVERYISIKEHIDLSGQTLTAATLSDVVRILLLREYGGVWADATLYCNRPLDEWLYDVMDEGFFAFAAPGPDRILSSWFLSAEAGNELISAWCGRVTEYWLNRRRSDDYFWFHHLFGEMCETIGVARDAWSRIPKISADGPHSLQFGGLMHHPKDSALQRVDWSIPVFKLTYRLPEPGIKPGSLLAYLLDRDEVEAVEPAAAPSSPYCGPRDFASLKVSTENLGDHIQILAGLQMLSRVGIKPAHFIDRDNELGSAPELPGGEDPVGILLNGWFKTNREEWPPHPRLYPIIHGFHIRLFQCPELISDASIEFLRRHQPIGCRDVYTEGLLRSKGVVAFTSNCLSLTFPKRKADPLTQTEVFAVSRDQRLLNSLPRSIGPCSFVSHYSGSRDFAANMTRAEEILETYRSRARLIVTTLLHCALPAIAMGIPVVVFYPLNDEAGHASDRERFSSLDALLRIHSFDEMDDVDWNPKPIDVSSIKLQILDRFYEMAARWQFAPLTAIGPIAPSSVLTP